MAGQLQQEKTGPSEVIDEAHHEARESSPATAIVVSIADYRALVAHRPNLFEYLLSGPKVDDFEIEYSRDTGREIELCADRSDTIAPLVATRDRLPNERASVTHKFNIALQEGYIAVGLFPNGRPGEIFVRMSKEGSTILGLMDSFAMVFSMAAPQPPTFPRLGY